MVQWLWQDHHRVSLITNMKSEAARQEKRSRWLCGYDEGGVDQYLGIEHQFLVYINVAFGMNATCVCFACHPPTRHDLLNRVAIQCQP